MCVCMRCCLATVIAAAVLVMTQGVASDDKSPIPRISVAATATGPVPAPSSAAIGETSEGKSDIPRISVAVNPTDPIPAFGPVPQSSRPALQESAVYKAADGNTAVSDGSSKTTQLASSEQNETPRISMSGVSTSKEMGPENVENYSREKSTESKAASTNENVVKSSASGNVNDHKTKDVVTEFSITEVTRPLAATSPETSQVKNEATKTVAPGSPTEADRSKTLTNEETKDEKPGGSRAPAQQTAPTQQPAPVQQPATEQQPAPVLKPAPIHNPAPVSKPPASIVLPLIAKDNEAKVLQINSMVVEKMIKPVAASSSVKPPPEDSAKNTPTEPAVKVDSLQASKGSEDVVPQVNLEKMIKPVSALSPVTSDMPQADPAARAAQSAATNPIQDSTDKEAKVEGPATPSDTSEVAPQLLPALLVDPQSSSGNKGLAGETSAPPSGDQALTTVISPVHAVLPDTATGLNQKTNVGPVAESAVNVLGDDGSPKSEMSTNKKTNAYTMTPVEFAKITAVVHAQKSDEESKEPTATVSESIPDTLATHQADAPKPDQGQTSDDHKSATSTEQKITQDAVEEEKPLTSSNVEDNLNKMSVLELAKKITNDLKAYSNEVILAWEKRKERISWLGDAADVLHNYDNKISETAEHANSCITEHRGKYERRKKRIQDIIKDCERVLERKSLHELQAQINTKISEVTSIVSDVNAQTSITKEAIENAKRKLQEINSESVNKTFSELKADALKTDEEDYKKCIDSKEADNKKEITDDTLSDIMKIYYCVSP